MPFSGSISIFSCASRQPEKLVYCPEMVWTFITQTEMRPWCRALGITFPVAKQDNLPQLKVNQNCVVIYYLLALQLLCYSWQSLKVYNPKHNTHDWYMRECCVIALVDVFWVLILYSTFNFFFLKYRSFLTH